MRRRVFVLFLTQILLRFLLVQANHSLAAWHMHLFLGAAFLLHATLTFSFGEGLLLAFLAGFLYDAGAPVAFGTHAFLFAFGHVLLFRLRDRLPREETLGRVVVALFLNLALFLVFSFLQVSASGLGGALWPRLIFDLVWSQLALALIMPWFEALQERSLVLTRAQPRSAL